MLSSIKIKGFQSHLDTEIEFHPGLNILVGASDAGKTSIHRAIRWVVHNEPHGTAFMSKRVETTSVTLDTDSGDSVVRSRGRENSYEVNGKLFQGFGALVPEEVRDLLGMQKAEFSDREVWLSNSSQLDAPFLLTETSGQAARMLGKLAGTEDLDAAGKLANSELVRSRQSLRAHMDQQEKLGKELLEYSWLSRIECLLDSMRALYEIIENKKAIRDSLIEIRRSLLSIQGESVRANEIVESIRPTETQTLAVLNNTRSDLLSIDGQLKLLTAQGERSKAILAGVRGVPSIDDLKSNVGVLSGLTTLRSDLGTVQSGMQESGDRADGQGSVLRVVSDEYEKYLVDLGICPVCNAPMEEERIHQYIKGEEP